MKLRQSLQELEQKLADTKAQKLALEQCVAEAEKRIKKIEAKLAKEQEYSRDIAKVREGYVQRIHRLCRSISGPAHRVMIFDKDSELVYCYGTHLVSPGASHLYLPPEHYEEAQPSQMEHEAYLAIGKKIWVEPTPHLEVWGN